jgi:hypothetical protein
MNFYTLPRARQRLIAGGFLAAAIMVAGIAIGAPLAGMIAEKRQAIRKGEAELARWRGIAASADVMQAASTDPSANLRAAAIALPASTDAQAAASVQAMVRRILADAGADLKSIQPLDARGAGLLREAGVRVVAVATQRQLDDALFAIDNANPRLFVREANFQLASGGARSRDEQPAATTLQIRLDVFAYAVPEE